MAHWQACETQVDVVAGAGEGKRRRMHASIVAFDQGDLVGERGDFDQQLLHFARLGAVVQRRNDLDRARHFFKVGLQLGLEGFIEHD